MLKSARGQAVTAWMLHAYLGFALRTTRWTLVGAPHAARTFGGEATIVAFWHERLPMMAELWRMSERAGTRRGVTVLASRHRDGRLLAELMRRIGTAAIYGSSSRGGATALRAAARVLAQGGHIAITPDGPRGPRRQAQPGVAQLAALAAAPVLPAAAQTTRRLVLNSWDRMVIPLPFGRGVIVCAPLIDVARAGWQEALPAIAAALDAAAATADALCHVPP